MSVQADVGGSSNYFSRMFTVALASVTQLVRPASHPRRVEAMRKLARQALALTAIGAVAVVVLMVTVDAAEISLMPPRGTASLWPVRILTDFGKDAYLLLLLAGALVLIAIVLPLLRDGSRHRLLRLGMRLEFIFLALLVPILAGELIKWVVGRGRPFVGGKANAFNFHPFTGTEAYFSFPSAHAITAFALAFAVSAVWPRARPAMIVYAILIALSRLVLLAHHPSDVVAGALIGVIGAMGVRYWFAVRRLGFAIGRDGAIAPPSGPTLWRRKRVARGVPAP
jgi:membrane-associated phospholipid phosphatase